MFHTPSYSYHDNYNGNALLCTVKTCVHPYSLCDERIMKSMMDIAMLFSLFVFHGGGTLMVLLSSLEQRGAPTAHPVISTMKSETQRQESQSKLSSELEQRYHTVTRRKRQTPFLLATHISSFLAAFFTPITLSSP